MKSINKMGNSSRRTVIVAGASACGMLLAGRAGRVLADAGPVQTIRLSPEAAERALPARFWGYNSPGTYIPYEMPSYVPAVKALGPHFLRFPGGTVGNYYNWHTGFMEVPDAGDAGGVYRKLMVSKGVPAVRKAHPEGVWVEDWQKIANAVDADMVIEANLETSTPEEQAAWFADMKSKGVPANHVEMGTEFFLAMGDDMGRKKFPNPEYTTHLTKQFVDAIRPQLPADAKVAVQSSAAAFEMTKAPGPNAGITAQRIWDWDQALKSEPWFDAVTIHFYPSETGSAGLDRVKKLPDGLTDVFDAMLGRADGGFDRGISDVAQRAPGKEIWMTEYGGFDPAQTFYHLPIHFSGLWLHQITREMLTMMRHPQLTVSGYHALECDGTMMSTFAKDGDGLKPINAAAVQSWFFHASRGPGCTWQRMTIDGAKQIVANGKIPGETYWDVDAGMFRRGSEHTLFIHNASKTPRRIDLSSIMSPRTATSAETIATPDLLVNLELGTPVPQQIATTPSLEVPAYSITKVTWSA
jgi:hypothetical protein